MLLCVMPKSSKYALPEHAILHWRVADVVHVFRSRELNAELMLKNVLRSSFALNVSAKYALIFYFCSSSFAVAKNFLHPKTNPLYALKKLMKR